MGVKKKIRRKDEESGVALLLSIFVLLLVCVVGIAMLSASGTETSLTGNYRSATAVYYAALSGLEEGRGRLLPRSPNYLGTAVLPATLPLGQVIYITNPLPSDGPIFSAYPDTEYATEFAGPPSSTQLVSSAQTITNPPNSPNPLYKWVRINALTERALQINVNCSGGSGCGGGGFNQTALIYFDGTNLTRTATPYQALEVSSLAALSNGSNKLLQYVVAPMTLQLPIAAALTLASPGAVANNVTVSLPAAYSFQVNGNDRAPGSNGGVACGSPGLSIPAVGVLNGNDHDYLYNTALAPHPGNYLGAGGTTPNVSPSPYVHPYNPNYPYDMTDAASLSSLVQLIQNGADSVVTGPATGSDMPPAMSFSNPMTVVVNGDLTLSGYTGYGLLVVTGKFTYSGDSGWKGIVFVIGQGVVEETGSATGGEFDGAFFVANTNGGGGSLGPVSYTVANPGGKGIYFDDCWVSIAQRPITYKVLSFHEIPYP